MNAKRLLTIASYPAFLLAARYIPFDALPPSCGFLRMTGGLPCPTCGMTRSVTAIARFQVERAWHFNPLGFVFLGVFALWWVNAVYQEYIGRRSRLSDWVARHWTVLVACGVALILGYGGMRVWWILGHPALRWRF